MKDVYLCATFRTDESRDFNETLEKKLTEKGFSCFLPQRDSDQSGNRKRTFGEDIKGVDSCKVVVAVGVFLQSANWGLEIGYAYKSKKPVIILVKKGQKLDLMIEGASNRIIEVKDFENVDSYIDEIVSIVKELI